MKWTFPERIQFYSTLIAVIGLIVLRGPSAGQAGIVGNVVRHYVEETSAFVTSESIALSDIAATAIYTAGSADPHDHGHGGSEHNLELATVQDNSVQATGPASTTYMDGFKSNQITEYVVQDGDNISFIASDYGVSSDSILWANGLDNPNAISPGQVIRIPPVTGVVHTVQKGDTVEYLAVRYEADQDRIKTFNDLEEEGLEIGDEIVVPGGKIDTTIKKETKSQQRESKQQKRFAYLPDLGDYFRSPTSGFNWGVIHGRNGVDVASACGTPIYAAADGNVALAPATGYNGGFGKFVKLVHPNGTESIYAHMSKVSAKAGVYVSKGDVIGLMGTTGRSTGCHLHFEVHGARNPLVKY